MPSLIFLPVFEPLAPKRGFVRFRCWIKSPCPVEDQNTCCSKASNDALIRPVSAIESAVIVKESGHHNLTGSYTSSIPISNPDRCALQEGTPPIRFR